ncbi:MAG: UDP-N-acetylglucosamine 1-carboxyvinyltransferase [Clostridiaceae bacterium]
MNKFIINGGNKLYGKVDISGAKNAAVAILPAVVMSSGICVLENVPDIADVKSYIKILEHLGCTVVRDGKSLTIDPRGINRTDARTEEVRSMRGSYYLIGSLLSRFGQAVVDLQGGCNIGARPIDQHIKGFESLGATVGIEGDATVSSAKDLKGAHIFFDVVTVGATMNVMLAATMAHGQTILENAAREPHVVDLANFLNTMGADIKGAGTDVIRINGVRELKGCTYSVIPDQIEASTYMLATAACGGEVEIQNVIPKHLESISAKLMEMGVEIEEFDDSIVVRSNKRLKGCNIKTSPYPGFPTDVQQPMTAVMSIADGRSTVYESIYENRFMHLEQLNKMGALAVFSERSATIEGVPHLKGAKVRATDLRAGAALVIAGLVAVGTTEVSEIEHIDRGYPRIEEKLNSLGADIIRIEE